MQHVSLPSACLTRESYQPASPLLSVYFLPLIAMGGLKID